MARRTRCAAHRGGAALAPENSLLAFEKAVAVGADFVEFDVHLTADGDVAVIHDPTLDRTTEGTGPVAARTASELRRFRLRGPDGCLTDERMPMLGDVLDALAPREVPLLIEIKGPTVGVRYERRAGVVETVLSPRYEGLEEKLLTAVAKAGCLERVTVMAFNPDILAEVRTIAPNQRRTLLLTRAHVEQLGAGNEGAVAWAVGIGATEIGLDQGVVDAGVVRAAHAEGLTLGVWVVNDETAMRQFADLGVDILTTDRPDLAKRVLTVR